jgi:acyl-CoA thioesterase-1
MVLAAKQAGARVLLLGMQMPPNYGRDYGQRFAQLYGALAKVHKVGLVPFFLAGVADDPDSLRWFQPDRIHPIEAAHPRLLANVWPELKKGLR